MAVVSHFESLFARPYGSGETNVVRLSPNIMVLRYLNHTNQLTPDLKKSVIYLIQEGNQEIKFSKA